MGGVSSSTTAKSTYPEDDDFVKKSSPCTQRFQTGEKRRPSSMSLTIDAQVQLADDFGQDTLMGLQELDSQLAIFEESADLTAPESDITSDMQLSIGDVKAMAQLDESNISRTFPKSENAALPSSTGAWSVKANGTLMYVLTFYYVSFIEMLTLIPGHRNIYKPCQVVMEMPSRMSLDPRWHHLWPQRHPMAYPHSHRYLAKLHCLTMIVCRRMNYHKSRQGNELNTMSARKLPYL